MQLNTQITVKFTKVELNELIREYLHTKGYAMVTPITTNLIDVSDDRMEQFSRYELGNIECEVKQVRRTSEIPDIENTSSNRPTPKGGGGSSIN